MGRVRTADGASRLLRRAVNVVDAEFDWEVPGLTYDEVREGFERYRSRLHLPVTTNEFWFYVENVRNLRRWRDGDIDPTEVGYVSGRELETDLTAEIARLDATVRARMTATASA